MPPVDGIPRTEVQDGAGPTVAALGIAIPPTIQRAEFPTRETLKFTKRDQKAAKRLTRVAFETSRLMEFCTVRELTNQIGHDLTWWPAVIVKELGDNCIDAAEEADIDPVIEIDVSGDTVSIRDNGPGIAEDTVAGVLDYASLTSYKVVFASPTRVAVGNALMTILAMAFALEWRARRRQLSSHEESSTGSPSRLIRSSCSRRSNISGLRSRPSPEQRSYNDTAAAEGLFEVWYRIAGIS